MNRLLHKEEVAQRNRRKQANKLRHDADAESDGLADMPGDIDAILDRQATCSPPNSGIRRLLEMRREEQLLQQQLGDSYDL